jgi:hypothetical protein
MNRVIRFLLYFINYQFSTFFGLLIDTKRCKKWSTVLNELIDKHSSDTVQRNRCTITLGNTEIWVSNRYYSFGTIHTVNNEPINSSIKRMPNVRTAIRLAMFIDDLDKKSLKQSEIDLYAKIK